MLLRADTRSRIEHVLRGVVIAVLAVMLWQSLHQSSNGGRAISATAVDGRSLASWSATAAAPERLRLRLTAVPSAVKRAWLGAIAAAGTNVSWAGDLPATMIGANAIAAPLGGVRIDVAAPRGSAVVLDDELGVIDTLRLPSGGASVALPSITSPLTASLNGTAASAIADDSLVLRKVLVMGDVGWESKFVVAALEESGWKVDADLRVAPGVDVTQGARTAIDTSHYSAVIALDAAAGPAANRIVEFARNGGGVILTAQSAALDAFAPLRAGAVGKVITANPVERTGAVDLASLPLAPLTSLRNDAVAVDKRGSAVAVAGVRVGAGRVLQMGYQDTWRWRMAGDDQSVRDHRQWWTNRVSSVANSPAIPRSSSPSSDHAPLASFVAAIGPASVSSGVNGPTRRAADTLSLLFAVLALALAAEVASRRVRGVS